MRLFTLCLGFWLSVLILPAAADVIGRITVIDGDTIDVGSTRVRLFGIDAPEHDQTCSSDERGEWACGQWVTREAAALFAGRFARCTSIETDRYGRTVARCKVGDQDVARQLVQRGLAFAYRRYALDYDLDEKRAAVQARGLHASRVQSPEQFRAARSTASAGRQPVPDTGCAIKGNISSKGVRIYHMPGQRDYARTSIRLEKGERWFCTPAEAEEAGWRGARR